MNTLHPLRHPWDSLRLRWLTRRLKGEVLDFSFCVLLQSLRLLTILDREFRDKHLPGFECSFSFTSQDEQLDGAVTFEHGRMRVHCRGDPNADVHIRASTAGDFATFLLSGNPDIFRAMAEGLASYEGNFNSLLKFTYMVRDARGRLSLGW